MIFNKKLIDLKNQVKNITKDLETIDGKVSRKKIESLIYESNKISGQIDLGFKDYFVHDLKKLSHSEYDMMSSEKLKENLLKFFNTKEMVIEVVIHGDKYKVGYKIETDQDHSTTWTSDKTGNIYISLHDRTLDTSTGIYSHRLQISNIFKSGYSGFVYSKKIGQYKEDLVVKALTAYELLSKIENADHRKRIYKILKFFGLYLEGGADKVAHLLEPNPNEIIEKAKNLNQANSNLIELLEP